MHIGFEGEVLLELALATALIAVSIRYVTRRGGGASAAPWWRGGRGTFQGTTFGVIDDSQDYRSPDFRRTVYIAAHQLAPHFSAERHSVLEGLRPFNHRVEAPPELEELEFKSDEPEVLKEAFGRDDFRRALQRVFAGPTVGCAICISTNDHRRMLFNFPRYNGPESDLLLLMRSWPKKAGEEQPAEEIEALIAMASTMPASSFSSPRAAIPALPRLLASGVWNTFKLFLLVAGGLIVLFALFWLIASLG